MSEERRVLDAVPPPETTNRDLWRWRVDRTPDREWLRFEGRAWTFGEFDLLVRRAAAGLRAIGVTRGDRVLLGLKNRPEALQAQLALSQLGAVAVPVLTGLPIDELEFPINHSKARLLIADDPIVSMVVEHRDRFRALDRLIVLDDAVRPTADASPPAGDAPSPCPQILRFDDVVDAEPLAHEPLPGYDAQTLDLIVYTSGSTGRPKGVMLKAGALLACGLGYADLYQITPADNYICPTPLAHSLGCVGAAGISIVTGGRLTLVERFRPSTFWDHVVENEATVSVLFATHLNLLLEVSNGEPPPAEWTLRLVITHIHHPRFAEWSGVSMATIWGMSETCICSGSDPGYRGDAGPGYVGRPFAGGELAIVDIETGERLPPGVDGELRLRHPQIMLGYLDDPEATAATVEDGWIRTGDRAYQDHSGRTFFVGRYKAMIKRSGENVSAEEVEAALVAHPDVVECCVFGVEDRLRSEEVAAAVMIVAGAGLEAVALHGFVAERLVRWKLPRYLTVVEEPLPKLPNGKVDRVRTAEAFRDSPGWDAAGDAAAGPVMAPPAGSSAPSSGSAAPPAGSSALDAESSRR